MVGNGGTLQPFMNHPFFGEVAVIWKEGKYKVTVSNMYFNTAGLGIMKCNDLFIKKKTNDFETNKYAITAASYIEKYLNDLFLIKKTSVNW